MDLKDTVEMMSSPDFKERFKAEYFQLMNRIAGLGKMLDMYKAGTLSFKPLCSYEILSTQLQIMNQYALILRERAQIENIDLM